LNCNLFGGEIAFHILHPFFKGYIFHDCVDTVLTVNVVEI
jgi:hypothetical protein